jgi:hypothetical protein
MATAAAMAVLRATVLGNCGGGSSNEDGCHDSGGEDNDDGGNGIGDHHPCRPFHAHFVTHHNIANIIAHVVAIVIAFVSMQQRGRWQGWQE